MSGATAEQLPLGLALREGARLDNFLPGSSGAALAALRESLTGRGERVLCLVGPAAAGKSHLLQAAARAAAGAGKQASYLPLRRARSLDPALLGGLERMDLVCLDDVDAAAGEAAWEEALFHLHNRLDAAAVPLLLAAREAPARVRWRLPDLGSRWRAAVVAGLAHLDEAGCRAALQARARERGFEIPDEVAEYLLRRTRRDMHSLSALLERLDRCSLAAKRRVTVPFVKSLLEAGAG